MSNDFSLLSLEDYSKLVAADTPSPGGGSVAAVVAALAAALVSMTCGLNVKSSKNPDPQGSKSRLVEVSLRRKRLLELATLDAKAYEKLSKHWKEKGPEFEPAVVEATRVPLEIQKLAFEVNEIAQRETPNTSTHLQSDLREAALLLKAASDSCDFHIDSNLSLIQNEKVRAELLRQRKRI